MTVTRTVQEAFIARAARAARATAEEYGVPAAVTLAQAALESDWGRAHMGGANNYFGIKAYDKGGVPQIGPIAKGFVTLPTREVVNGRSITVNARFRSYASMADSFRDHANFLKVNSRYAPAFGHTGDPDAFARAIAKAGYATDPSYADKLIALMRQYKLYSYGKRTAKRDEDADGPEHKPEHKARTRRREQVESLQESLNEHLRRLGAPRLLATDGRWGPLTETAFEDVCRVLGIAAERHARIYRIIAGTSVTRTPAELARAEGDGAAFAEELRRRYARERTGATVRLGGTPLDEAAQRRARIAALQADLNGHLERLRQPTRLAVDGEWDPYTDRAFEAVCRVLGIEAERDARTFRIIAGALAGRTAAERERAEDEGAAYARRLRAAGVPQRTVLGGPARPEDERRAAAVVCLQRDLNQHLVRLGSPAVLALDGRWGEHTATAFREICKTLGLAPEREVRTYRLIGAALATPTDAERDRAAHEGAAFAEELRKRFARTPPPDDDGPPPPPEREEPKEHKPPKAQRVRALQAECNRLFEAWRVRKRITVDGKVGPETRKAAHEVAKGRKDPEFRATLRKRYATPDVGALLRGNAAPREHRLFEVIVTAHRFGLVVTSTTGGTHAPGSFHYQGRAVDFGVAGNPYSADAQRRFVAFQHQLARHPAGLAELIGPDVARNVKYGRFTRYPAATEQAHKNHVHCAI